MQNSIYMNSKASLKKTGENGRESKFDYKQVDFGYKNKEIPNIPGIFLNEHGKMDIASFLNDEQELIPIDGDISVTDDDNYNQRSERVEERARTINRLNDKNILDNQFLLDLEKVKGSEQTPAQKGLTGIEAALQQHSLSNRSNYFGSQS